jgi:transmembrane sensor
MSGVSSFPNINEAREQAALWVARMDRGLTATEQSELSQWLTQPVCRRALSEMQQVWQEADGLAELADDLNEVKRAQQLTAASRIWRSAAIAASIALTISIGWFTGSHYFRVPESTQVLESAEVHSTSVGEHRSVTLSDGSMITLNTNTSVEMRYSAGVRQLVLKRGEAHFEVAHDASRPFIVEIGARAVRAVGTAFDIRLRDQQALDVLVTAGTIQVLRNHSMETVTAGNLYKVDQADQSSITRVDALAMESALAWRRGVLIFDGETLGTAIAEMSRYTTVPLILEDATLSKVSIGGYFPTTDVSVLLAALQSNFGIESERTPTAIRLRRIKSASAARR